MNPLRYSLLFLCFVLLNGQRRIFNHVFISNQNQNQSTFECPEEFGYYPHPMDCTQYYVCVFGGPLLESCTGGLMYSHELQTCDWPRNVDCVNNEQRLVTVTTTTELPVMRFYENKNYQNDFFARPTPVIVSRGQPRQLINENLSNFMIKKQTVPLINDHITKNENDDRQQRVYRGQPSLIGQVQRDRDGLNHINSIIVNRNDEPQKEKEDFMEYTNNDQLDEKLRIAGQNADKKYLINVIRKKRQILFSSNEPHDRRSFLWTPDSHYHSLITDNTQNKISLKHFLTTQLPLRQSISLPYSLFRNNQNNFHYNANHFLSTSTVPTKITQKPGKLFSNFETIFRQSNNFNNENGNFNYPLLTIQNFFHSNLLYNNYKNNNNNKTNEYVPIFQQYSSLNGKQQYQVEPDELSPLKFLNFDNNNNNNNNYNYNYNNYNNYNNNHKYKVRPTPTYLYQTIPKMNTTNHTHYVQSSVYNNHNDNYHHHLDDHDQHHLHYNLSSLIDHNKVIHSKTNSLKNKANNYSLRSSTSTSDLNSNRTKFGQNQFKENYYNNNNNKNYNSNIKNNSQQYDTINYDSYYSIYDDDVELFRDKELEKEYNVKNENIDTKKITQNVPLKIVPHVTNPTQHLFSTQPTYISTENYNQKQKDSEHTVKIYDEIESIKNKDLSLMRGNKYLVNSNYLDSILSTVHDAGLTGTTLPTTLTTGQASTIDSKYLNQPEYVTKVTVPVRRQRPTLRPPSSIVTKNHEFINIYKSVPRRPESIYPTPLPDKTAAKCRKDICLLPDCNCGGKDIPGDLPVEEVPQIVLLTFDDSVNDLNKGLYNDLFNNGRRNPNGCPITATFYVSHEWTDYSQVQNLYADGHEIASHTISHSFGEQFSQKKWYMEVAGQREILAAYGGVNMEDIRGMRAPFLSVGGNKMFKMLYEANFTYDSSMPVYENRPPSYPYTLDYKLFHDCMIPPCPSKSYPGVWEVPMVMWQDLNGGRCSMGDACSNPMNSENVYQMIKKNFERHYTTNRAPFGLFYHAAWFTQQHHKDGFIRFLDEINQLNDVYILTNWQAIQWVREPMPLSKLKNFQPFDCDYKNRPKKCFHPRVCNLWHKSGVRYMRTCQTCPDIYPWTGKTGVKSSRMENDNTIE